MAKLAIYRGETLDREVALGSKAFRIGRGDQNDIVLLDPAKSVSRVHAELRFENGRYSVVDLNSQNGVWIAGKKVQQGQLEANVPVVLGSYRLVLVPDPPPPPAPPVLDAAESDATLVVSRPRPSVPVTPATPAAAPSLTEQTFVPGAQKAPAVASPGPSSPPPSRPPEIPPAVTAKPATVKSEPARAAAPKAEVPKAPAPTPPAAKPEVPAERPKPEPARTEPPKAEVGKAAPTPVAPKATAPPAPAKPPAPAPPATPASAPGKAAPKAAPTAAARKGVPRVALYGGFALLVLAVAAAGFYFYPIPGTGPSPEISQQETPSPAPVEPAAPQASPATQPSPDVPPPAAVVPATEAPPASTSARAVPSPAVRPGPPPVAPVTADRPAREPKPAAAATRKPVEPAAAPKARPRDLQTNYSLAKAAMIKGDYLAAVSGFEAVVAVDPKYADAAQLLETARGGARNAAQLAIDTGGRSETAGDYPAAIKQYEQALQLDPSSSAAADAMRRVRTRMQVEGEDAFKRARQYDALGRANEAIGMYEKALQLLPADHANAKTAKERLAALRGGD